MKKVTWLLGLSLLLGGGSVFAQEEKDPLLNVVIPSNEIQTFQGLRSVVDYLNNTLSGLVSKQADYERQLSNAQGELEKQLPTIEKTEEELPDGIQDYIDFSDKVQINPSGIYENVSMYYYTVDIDNGSGEYDDDGNLITDKLTIVTFGTATMKDDVSYQKPSGASDWIEMNLTKSKNYMGNGRVSTLRLLYKDAEGKYVMAQSAPRQIKNILTVVRESMSTLAKTVKPIEKTTTQPNPIYTAWQERVQEIKNNKKEYDDAIDKAETLKSISIKQDLSVEGVISDWIWPVDYKIDGNYHIISGSGATGASLFATNNGEINNLVVSTGLIAKKMGTDASITNSIARIATGNYVVYNAMGAATENIASLEDAAYALRDIYGYDMKEGKIAAVTPVNKLYQAKYANAEHKDVYSFKVNIDETNSTFKYNESSLKTLFTKGYTNQNAVIYIDETDVPATVAAWQNVAVRSGDSYTCANTVMEEGDGVSEFYIPFGFTSSKLTYTRDFKQDLAAVCLPFALTSDDWEELGIKFTHQFRDVNPETNTMWFSYQNNIPANEPCIITFKNANNGQLFKEYIKTIKFEATAGSDLGSTSGNGERNFYGSYARTLPTSLSMNDAYTIYGIQGGRLVKAPATSYLNQFRSYVRYKGDLTAEAPSFRIGLLDENDNEIATGVESVSAEKAGSFKVMGGNNAIEVSTDKACDVKVYAVNGTVVKSVHVEAGNTSLPVKAGVYVVNGTKVIVK